MTSMVLRLPVVMPMDPPIMAPAEHLAAALVAA